MADASLVQQVLPRRLAAKQASASITQQLDGSDSDAAHTQNSSPSPNRVTIKYGRKAKAMRKRMGHGPEVKQPTFDSRVPDMATSSGLNGVATPVKGQVRSTRKRPFSQDSTSQDTEVLDSPLTPISDTDTFSSTLSPPPTSPVPPSFAPRPFPLVESADNGTNSSNYGTRGKRKRREPSGPKRWKKKDLGDFVWVLIDDQSRIFDNDKTVPEREYVWWPGRIRPPLTRGGRPISVYLYGQTVSTAKHINVSRPTEGNILPFSNSAGEACFHVPTYVTPSREDGPDILMSPRKKLKRDRHELEARWNSAILELNAQRDGGNAIPGGVRPGRAPNSIAHSGASDDESLPEVGEMDWKASLASIPGSSQNGASPAQEKQKEPAQKRRGRRKGIRKATPISEGESDYGIRRLEEDALGLSGQDDLFAQQVDEALQVPGELILAKGTNGDKSYWPARVLEFVPPKNKKERERKYKIEYLDRTTSVLDRNAFYTSEEDGFGTCKLGKFESSYDDTANDSETEGASDSLPKTRCPSPIPANPPPDKESFFELDMRSQFVYTKPILVAILNEQYAPARERHDQFLKGGQARKSIVDSAMLRGEIVPHSVGELQRWLCEWCLRGKMLGKERAMEMVESLEANGAGTSHEEPETAQSGGGREDTIESGEATRPPSSVITCTTLPSDGPPNSSSLDVTMEDVIDKASPLSALSSLTNEATPAPLENKEEKMMEESGDATESMSELTELEDPASKPDANAPVSETIAGLPRQSGCPAYEALTSMEKLEYCLNVLLPEAILQILLWRKGLRTTTEILSQDEEERLHTEGAKLLHITDWVYDVVRLRRLHERKIAKKNNKDSISSSQKSDRGGGRLRKVGRINYHE